MPTIYSTKFIHFSNIDFNKIIKIINNIIQEDYSASIKKVNKKIIYKKTDTSRK